jgi:hypothetical protein
MEVSSVSADMIEAHELLSFFIGRSDYAMVPATVPIQLLLPLRSIASLRSVLSLLCLKFYSNMIDSSSLEARSGLFSAETAPPTVTLGFRARSYFRFVSAHANRSRKLSEGLKNRVRACS